MWKLTSPNTISPDIFKTIEESYDALLQRQDLGFFKTAPLDKAIASINAQIEPLVGETMVVIGVGGSSLGAKALLSGTFPERLHSSVVFMDNVDGESIQRQLRYLKTPSNCTWVLISKSGSTLETLSIYDHCLQFFRENFSMDIAKKTVVISEDKDSPLTAFAKKNQCRFFTVPKDVGGRFSVFTPVGLVPMRLAGLDLGAIASGFRHGLQNKDFVFALAGELLQSRNLGESRMYVCAYRDRLAHFCSWLLQLWSESLGKAELRDQQPAEATSALIPFRGSSDQHSILQQISDGSEKKFLCFLRETQPQFSYSTLDQSSFGMTDLEGKSLEDLFLIQSYATQEALRKKDIRSLSLEVETLDLTSLTELMLCWMLTVGTLGETLNMDAFNQPGVELGKRITKEKLAQG